MNNISRVKIGDIGKTITGKTPSSSDPEDFGAKYMFVTPSDSFDKKIMNSTERFLSEEGAKKLSKKLLPPKSVMITCIGSAMGKVSMNETSCVTNQQINSIVPNNHFDPDYIYYAIKNNYKVLRNAATGSTALPLINKTDFDILEIPLHKDKIYQQKISSVLSPLDAKIELNNKVNRELEAMAKTLYDYWFVQFDFPDANGRPYKSSGGKMVYNAELKREIPEGWCIEKLPKCCSIIDCLHSKKPDFHFENEKYYLLQLENLKDDGLIDSTNKYFVTKNDYDNWTSRIEVRENDIVITNAGRVGATAQIPKGMVAGIGRNITAIRPFSISPTYLFLAFRGIDMRRQIAWNTDQGAFFTSLNVKGIKQLFIVRPPFGIESEFEKNVLAIRTKRELIQRQNQHLTALRDWLLPMLMNGQVRVKEAALRQAQDEISMAAEPSVKYGN